MHRIVIEFKPLDSIRNQQLGDYFYQEDGTLVFHIADTGNEFYNKSILLHELFEETATKQNGIEEPTIANWDAYFEKRREQGLVPKDAENGFDKNAPYMKEHTAANAIEQILFSLTNMSWSEYDNFVSSL